jgi:hypothetical protein
MGIFDSQVPPSEDPKVSIEEPVNIPTPEELIAQKRVELVMARTAAAEAFQAAVAARANIELLVQAALVREEEEANGVARQAAEHAQLMFEQADIAGARATWDELQASADKTYKDGLAKAEEVFAEAKRVYDETVAGLKQACDQAVMKGQEAFNAVRGPFCHVEKAAQNIAQQAVAHSQRAVEEARNAANVVADEAVEKARVAKLQVTRLEKQLADAEVALSTLEGEQSAGTEG